MRIYCCVEGKKSFFQLWRLANHKELLIRIVTLRTQPFDSKLIMFPAIWQTLLNKEPMASAPLYRLLLEFVAHHIELPGFSLQISAVE